MITKRCVNPAAYLVFAVARVSEPSDKHRPCLIDLEAVEIDQMYGHRGALKRKLEETLGLLRRSAFGSDMRLGKRQVKAQVNWSTRLRELAALTSEGRVEKVSIGALA
jgi:hypothetical protein